MNTPRNPLQKNPPKKQRHGTMEQTLTKYFQTAFDKIIPHRLSNLHGDGRTPIPWHLTKRLFLWGAQSSLPRTTGLNLFVHALMSDFLTGLPTKK